jgi:anaerobic magnesium-protoporphyrin IX monomethyl ester cyclase
MNILFVQSLGDIQSLAKPLQTHQQIQFGISYISSVLKKNGHNTRLVILNKRAGRKNKNIINESLKKFRPKLICFTAVATEYDFIAGMAKYVKNSFPDIYLLIGGPHAALNPQEVISDSFDALCIGEGEYPTIELVAQLETGAIPSGIANLWIKHGSEIERNPARPFIQDLDSLPFPDREMWVEWIEDGAAVKNSVLISRGCPFACTYCCNHALRKLADGDYVRFRTVGNIIEEIKQIITRFPATKQLFLEAETIGLNKPWAIELCAELERLNATLQRPLSFGANIRITPNADLEELFAAFKKSNFQFINIGVESGSERVRREILKRNYSNEDIINAVTSARKYGLKTAFFNMVGLPGETIKDFKETVKINRRCRPDWHYASIFFPYPGTELYSLCKGRGLLKGHLDTTMERKKAVLDLPDFPKKQVQKSYIWFDYYVYRGLKPNYKIFASVLRSKFASKNYLNSLYRKITSLSLFRTAKQALKGLPLI